MVNINSPTQRDHVFVQCTEVTDSHGKCIQFMMPNTMLSIINALNKPAHKFSLVPNIINLGVILINSHTKEYKAVAIRSYIHSVCIKFVNTLPWAVPSVDVYKSDTDLMNVLQPLLTYSQACTIQDKIQFENEPAHIQNFLCYYVMYIAIKCALFLMLLYEM